MSLDTISRVRCSIENFYSVTQTNFEGIIFMIEY